MAAVAAILLIVAVVVVGRHYMQRRYSPRPPAVAEGEFEVYGLDLSAHNGDVNFAKVKDEGYTFVILKASEGSTFKDGRFEENYTEAVENRLYVGAYHFFRFDVDGIVQAHNFMEALDGKDLSLPVAIDLEEYGNPREIDDVVVRRLHDMIDELTVNEYPVMIYTNKDGYERFVRGNFDDYPLWLCSFVRPPADMEWTLWQYSHWGESEATDGDVDLNIFFGNASQWEQWIQ